MITMTMLMLTQLAFPPARTDAHIRIQAGRWNQELSWYNTDREVWRDLNDGLGLRLDTVPQLRHRIRSTIRDAAYSGLSPSYERAPLPAPGDTVPIYMFVQQSQDSTLFYDADSTRAWLVEYPGNVGPSPNILAEVWAPDSAHTVELLGALRPAPGDSLGVQGCYQWFFTVNDSIVGHDGGGSCSNFLWVFSDTLLFPPLPGAVVIDTIPPPPT